MRANAKRWFPAAAALLAFPGAAWVWSGRERPQAPVPAPRRAVLSATGRIEARRQASVRAKGAGSVLRWARPEGTWAREGEVVVILDQDLERANFAEAEAELFRASSQHRRLELLRGQGVASDQEFEDVEAARRLASSRRDKARALLADRVLRAPFSGRIVKTYLEAGESLSPPPSDAVLFVIGDTRSLKVVAEVDELDSGLLAEGRRVEVLPDALPGEAFAGRVSRVSCILGRKRLVSDDPRERMDAKVLEVEIPLEAEPRLRPGLTVQVRIAVGADGGRKP